MRQNTVTIVKGDREAEVVESSFESVWKERGWELKTSKPAPVRTTEPKSPPPPKPE